LLSLNLQLKLKSRPKHFCLNAGSILLISNFYKNWGFGALTFDIRDLSGNKVNKGSISCKKLQLLERAKHYLTEKRTAIPPQPTEVVVSLP
jgi:hypothetical protein